MFNRVYIEISNVCNLQCSFCPEVIRAKKLMSVDLFSRIIEQVSPVTKEVTFHLMGEPLLHPHFHEFVQICKTNSMRIFLVTNGTLLREKHFAIMLEPVFRQINFSLHSFPDNFRDKDPTDYLEGIFQFTEQAFEANPDLYINYRLWNLQDPKGTTAQNQGMLEQIRKRFNNEVDVSTDVRFKKSIRLKNRLYLHFDTEFIWPAPTLPILGKSGTCYGLDSHFGVLVDGTVVPCCLDKEGNIPLGNIQTTTLSSILESPRALAIIEGFRERKLVEDLCQRCQYIQRFN